DRPLGRQFVVVDDHIQIGNSVGFATRHRSGHQHRTRLRTGLITRSHLPRQFPSPLARLCHLALPCLFAPLREIALYPVHWIASPKNHCSERTIVDIRHESVASCRIVSVRTRLSTSASGGSSEKPAASLCPPPPKATAILFTSAPSRARMLTRTLWP